MKGYSKAKINHVSLNSLLQSNSSSDILKMFSQQFMPLEKQHSDNIINERATIDTMELSERKSLSKSMSAKSSKKDHNFKVVVRIRPQLRHELGMSA